MEPGISLESFLNSEIAASELLSRLEPRVAVIEDDEGRTHVRYAGDPIPHVQFTREHVARVLDRVFSGELTLEEASAWANLVTLFDFFDLAPGDHASDEVWDVLDRLAHPEQADTEEPWKLRQLRDTLDQAG